MRKLSLTFLHALGVFIYLRGASFPKALCSPMEQRSNLLILLERQVAHSVCQGEAARIASAGLCHITFGVPERARGEEAADGTEPRRPPERCGRRGLLWRHEHQRGRGWRCEAARALEGVAAPIRFSLKGLKRYLYRLPIG